MTPFLCYTIGKTLATLSDGKSLVSFGGVSQFIAAGIKPHAEDGAVMRAACTRTLLRASLWWGSVDPLGLVAFALRLEPGL